MHIHLLPASSNAESFVFPAAVSESSNAPSGNGTEKLRQWVLEPKWCLCRGWEAGTRRGDVERMCPTQLREQGPSCPWSSALGHLHPPGYHIKCLPQCLISRRVCCRLCVTCPGTVNPESRRQGAEKQNRLSASHRPLHTQHHSPLPE